MNYTITPILVLTGGLLGGFSYSALSDESDLHEFQKGFAIGQYLGMITGNVFDYLLTNLDYG